MYITNELRGDGWEGHGAAVSASSSVTASLWSVPYEGRHSRARTTASTHAFTPVETNRDCGHDTPRLRMNGAATAGECMDECAVARVSYQGLGWA
jgi:hypothetical protein